MGDRRRNEPLEIALPGFAKRFNFKHVSEYIETHQQCADNRGSKAVVIVEMSAEGSNKFFKDKLAKHGRCIRAGKRSGDYIERPDFGLRHIAVPCQNLPCEMNVVIFSPLRQEMVGLDRRPQGCGKQLLLGAKASVYIGNIGPSIARDVAQTGFLIRVPRKSLYRSPQNTLFCRK